MKHIATALLEAFDLPQFRQPATEQPHCVARQADLYAAADEMGEWAEHARQNPSPENRNEP